MADREKVIRGLECCTGIHEHCNECPYDVGISFCHIALKKDILDLLKASSWISVKDRLPEKHDVNDHKADVLLFIPEREGVRQHGIYLGFLSETPLPPDD